METSGADSIGRILRKLGEARRRGLRCFGSDHHGFVLDPPLDTDAVLAFEREHAVSLPEGYREFLIHAGNGGAGPYYGMHPLSRWSVDLRADDPGPRLTRPSPLRPDLDPNVDIAGQLGCDWEDLTDGAISLVSQGCAYASLLIVTGELRGRVVNIDGDFGAPPYFCRDRDVLAWYERWLDELLWGWDGSWFGYGLPGTEPDLIEVLRTARSRPADRSDALRTLSRIPTLSDGAAEALREALADEEPSVRVLVLGIVARRRLPLPVAALADQVAHHSLDVRRAAVGAATSLGVSGSDLLLAASHHGKAAVELAFLALENARALDADGLRALADSEDDVVRQVVRAHR
jgi:hypothetical protein